jgi:YgiT-type zinc finger domain-containing protein
VDDTVKVSTECPACGAADAELDRVRTALWQDERLVVVEGVPALVCRSCGEQYFDDTAIVVLDLLRGDGFPAERAARMLEVPVFSFDDRLAGEGT